jgi:Flp pilus assembly pilin Flp
MRKGMGGQSLVEYLIIVAIVAIGSIAVVQSLGHTIYVRFANITNALQNNTTEIQVNPASADDYRKRGLDDFFKSASGSNHN